MSIPPIPEDEKARRKVEGARLRKERMRLGLTQYALGKMSGVATGSIANAEQGRWPLGDERGAKVWAALKKKAERG